MKTRAEIYGNEAADLLRTVTMYPGLSEQQLLCFHPGKEDTAVWVLLDFIQRADYHAPADFPVKIVFFADGELYEVACVEDGQEALVCHALRGNKGGSRRIILVDSPAQIAKIDCPGISGFCTVEENGQTHYFKKAGGT